MLKRQEQADTGQSSGAESKWEATALAPYMFSTIC